MDRRTGVDDERKRQSLKRERGAGKNKILAGYKIILISAEKVYATKQQTSITFHHRGREKGKKKGMLRYERETQGKKKEIIDGLF